MNKPLVTIITPTTGTQYLEQNIESVLKQTYPNIQHLVVVDGLQESANGVLAKYRSMPKIDIMNLPYNTGHDQYNGHRIYGGCTFFAKGEYIMFLDEDNWLEPNHVESLVDTIVNEKNVWAYSLRKIVNDEGRYLCNDDCESLGNWMSIINDYFVDVNCFLLPRPIALQFAPGWYRRARHPNEQPEVDRLLTFWLREQKYKCDTSGQYTVNYRVGSRADSVQAEFFLRGNDLLKERHTGGFPWRKI